MMPALQNPGPENDAIAPPNAPADRQSFIRPSSTSTRATELLSIVGTRDASSPADFYDVGSALREMFDHRLHLELGYESFEALIRAGDAIGITQAKKLISVVRAFDRPLASRIGLEKAFALTRYCAHSGTTETPAEIVERGLPDGEGRRRRIEHMTLRSLQARARNALNERRMAARTESPATTVSMKCDVIATKVDGAWRLRLDVPLTWITRMLETTDPIE